MTHYYLTNDNDSDLEFDGQLVAYVTSESEDKNMPKKRWTEIYLYKTESGKYVTHEVGCTVMPNERDRFQATIHGDHRGVVNGLGMGWLAKELYAEAGITTSISV